MSSLILKFLIIFLFSIQIIKGSSLMDAYNVAQNSAEAEAVRINIIAENIANIENVNYKGKGKPYQRKELILSEDSNNKIKGKVVYDKSSVKFKFDPQHPLANKNGYVAMPAIEVETEKVNLMKAKQLYDLNLSVMELTKSMIKDTLSAI